jgi:hypothetical protein
MPKDRSGGRFQLPEKIVSERKRRAEILTADGSSVLRQQGCGLQNQVGLGNQIFERFE